LTASAKKPSDPLILAISNLVIIVVVAFLPSSAFGGLATVVAIPLGIALLLLTLIFALRDLRRNRDRVQAFAALALSLPVGILWILFRVE
jgi:hypothetical protein